MKMDNYSEHSFYTCRACLKVSDMCYPIFKDIPQVDVNVASILRSCSLDVNEDDDLPKTICSECFVSLQAVHQFIEIFKKSQELLLKQYFSECEEKFISENEKQDFDTNVLENSEVKEGIFDFPMSAQQYESVTENNTSHNMESFVITCETDEDNIADDSDDQNFLIEKSVQLTKYYRKYKLNGMMTSDINLQIQQYSKKSGETDVSNSLNMKPINNRIMSCPHCSKTFKRFQRFSVHLIQHKKPVTCKLCSVHFDDVDFYLKHFKMKHRYQCKICGQSLHRSDTLRRHIQAHNNTLPQYICPIKNCLKSFSVKQSLQNHMTVHSEKRNFLCSLCGASFRNSDNLRYHMKKHKGPSHLCPYCGKTYIQAVHLKYHMWRHTGIKPYRCSKCERSFVSKKPLIMHIQKGCEVLTRKQ